MKHLFTFFCFFFLEAAANAQGEANNWVFGGNAGVSWNSGVPVAFSGSAMSQPEGCCCISNAAGNLLFYSDGIFVWNSLHQQMPNGFGLLGDASSTQSAVVVPWPGSASKFILFTQDDLCGANGFRYSVVDMNLQGGLGDVVAASKNTLLYNSSCEKISVTKHTNGTDFWVASHQYNTDAFYTYLVTSAGVNATPVISHMGAIEGVTNYNTLGYMKFSPDGQKLGVAVWNASFVEAFQFDQSTGMVGTLLLHDSNYNITSKGPYGLEFSPNSNVLYVLENGLDGALYQYDMQAANILGSRFFVADVGVNAGALQLAVDQKIYAAAYSATSLAVINTPDVVGAGCGFQGTAVLLTSGTSSNFGLPTFIQSYFSFQNDFTFQNTCLGEATAFSITNAGADSARWNFGDIVSGAANVSSLLNPSHLFSSADTFTVFLRAWKNGIEDSATQQVVIQPIPVVSLGNDTTLCNGQSVLLNATAANGIYLWQNNSTSASQPITQGGTYWVEVTIANCAAADTVQISFVAAPVFNLGPDTTICSPNMVPLNVNFPGAVYHWQDNSSAATYQVTQTGDYSATVSVSGCQTRDTIHVLVNSLPQVSINTANTVLCPNNNTQICVASGAAKYNWNQGDTTACITAGSAGSYFVTATDINGCTAVSNSIAITIGSAPVAVASTTKNIFCAGDSTEVCATSGYAHYLWSNAKTDSCIQAHQAGNYYVTVTDNNGCTATSNHLPIHVYPLPPISISVNGDTLSSFNGVTYQWYLNGGTINNATENMYVANQGGSYTVAITDTNGCSVTSNPIIISGINDLIPAFSVNVYPNPLDNGFWNLDCAGSMVGSQIEIFDADGRLVFESTITKTQSQIELSAARGIYMLRIRSTNNSIVKKLIRL